MKKILVILSILIVTACSSSSDDGGTPDTITTSLSISGIGNTSIIDETGLYDLIISGSSNTVTVKSGNMINTLDLGGVTNLVMIENNVTINEFIATGTDGTAIVPVGSGHSFINSGVGNSLIEQ